MTSPLAGFEDFCKQLPIPSKDQGRVMLSPLFGTQRYLLREIEAGIERDQHDFLPLKGRQQGITTVCDAIDLFWPQKHDGIQGIMVSDSDKNRDFRRDVILDMFRGLPRSYRVRARINNQNMLAWENGSRLMFDAAGVRNTNLGRSRGLNYCHGDEVGSWQNQKAVSALKASLSERHPYRLFIWPSTAQGYGVFHDMWKEAEHAVTTRRIFIGWYLHDHYQIDRSQTTLWDAYGTQFPSATELQWMRVVERRYEILISPEQIAWYRYQLAEKFFNDEVMLAQEHPCLPEDAFQAFGDKFIAPSTIQRLRIGLDQSPTPVGYRYEWAETLDETRVREEDPDKAPLKIWEEPDANGVYLVSAHPTFGSSADARTAVVQVYRVWKDRMRQVAEYTAETGSTYQFAWAALHLAGAYKHSKLSVYFVLELGASGMRVLQEIRRLEDYGYGLSERGRQNKLPDLLGSVRHYLYRRPDLLRGNALLEWKTGPTNRPWMLHGLSDEVERGHVDIRSADLIDDLAAMRRGEKGDMDELRSSGERDDSRVVCAALAVEHWLQYAMPDLVSFVGASEQEKGVPTHMGELVVGNFLNRVLTS